MMAEQWRLVTPGSDGPEPCPPEYEPVGEPDDSELDEIPWGLGDEDEPECDEDWDDEEDEC